MSAGISAAATSSRTDGTSRSATTSWIFGAARAACSASRRGLTRAGLLGQRGQRPAGGGPEPVGAPERLRERVDAAAGRAPLEAVERQRRRDAERDPPRRRAQLGGEHAGMPAADLPERAPRRQPGADGDPQQVEHVGELRLDGAAARRARVSGGPGRARTSRRAARRASAAGRPGGERERGDGPPRSRRASFAAITSPAPSADPRRLDPRGEPARRARAAARAAASSRREPAPRPRRARRAELDDARRRGSAPATAAASGAQLIRRPGDRRRGRARARRHRATPEAGDGDQRGEREHQRERGERRRERVREQRRGEAGRDELGDDRARERHGRARARR